MCWGAGVGAGVGASGPDGPPRSARLAAAVERRRGAGPVIAAPRGMLRPACLAASLLVAMVGVARADDGPRDPAALGRWLEALGVPSPAGKPWLRVAPDADEPTRRHEGVLLEEADARVVLLQGIAVWSYPSGGTPERGRLDAEVEPEWPRWLERNARPTRALTLAAAAWQDRALGREAAAERRFAAAAAARPDADAPLGAHLADEVPRVLLWAALGAAGDASWETTRGRLERIAAAADGSWAERAAALAARVPAAPAPAPGSDVALGTTLRSLGVRDATDLVAGLVHARGALGEVLSPVVACGPAAAPALLAALDDPTLTRVRRPLHRRPERSLYRRGELARIALERLAARFTVMGPDEGHRFPSAADARAWWARAEAEGPFVHMLRQVDPSPQGGVVAWQVRQRAPERGPALLVEAARRDPSRRAAVLFALSHPPHRAGRELARDTLADPRAGLQEVFSACRLLGGEAGPPSRAHAMRLATALAEAVADPRLTARVERRTLEGTLGMLIDPDAPPRAVAAVRRLYPELPRGVRDLALQRAASIEARLAFAGDQAEEATALLVDALDDEGAWRDGVALNELAAYLLAPRLGARYDSAAPPEARAAVRAELTARWRAGRGLR